MDHRKKSKVSRMKSFVELEDEGRDRRVERAHRRSIDQRQMRLQHMNKHRNFSSEDSDLSMIKEAPVASPPPEKKPLKERLKKWQQARDARKRQEKELERKKPGFKVSHASRDILAYNRPVTKLADRKNLKMEEQVPKKTGTTKQDKPAATGRRVTRSQSQPKKAEVAQPAAKSSRQIKTASSKQPAKPALQPTARNTRSSSTSTRSQKPAVEPSGRVTRARNNVVPAKKPEPQKKKSKEPAVPVAEEKKSNKKFVTQERGSAVANMNSASFAPQDFTFCAPGAVEGYSFRPLSPATAASFLFPGAASDASPALRRCSTPARTSNPVVHSPALSTIALSEKKPALPPTLNQSQDQTNGGSSSIKRRRSTRNTGTSQTDTESEAEAPARKAARSHRRSTRRSHVLESTTDSDDIDGIIHEPKSLEANRRKSRRRSKVQPDVMAVDDEVGSINTKTPKRRSSHQAMQASSQSEESDAGTSSVKTPRRRSTRRSIIVPEEHMSSAKESGAESDVGVPMATSALCTIPEVPQVAPRSSTTKTRRSRAHTDTAEGNVSVVQDSTISTTTCPPITEIPDVNNEEQNVQEDVTAASVVEVIDHPAPVNDVSSEGNLTNMDTPKTDNASDGVFRTPSSTARKTRRKTVHGSTGKTLSARKTPKHRNSLMMKTMSPEERIDFMSNSPMVEMSRRTPKQTLPEILPLPDFEELEHEVSSYSSQSEAVTATESEHEEHGDSSQSVIDNSSCHVVVTATVEPVPADQRDDATESPLNASKDDDTTAVSSKTSAVEPEIVHNTEVPETNTTETTPETSEKPSSEGEHDILYFRNLIISERKRLGQFCEKWETLNTPNVPEEASGEIRTTIGKAHLLMNQRFKQFEGLVDNCEFGLGEKVTHCSDLQGFWDMIYFQVEDVDAMFADLDKLQGNNWKSDKPQPKKKVIKKKVVKPATKKPAAAKSGFAAFRAKMASQKKPEESLETTENTRIVQASPVKIIPEQDDPEENKENIAPEQKVFDAGFFNISSPVKEPEFHCTGGSPNKSLKPSSLGSSSAFLPVLSASPMLKAVLTKSARKSMSVDPKMRRSSRSRRGSWAMGDASVITPSKAALVSLKLSPMAKVTPPTESMMKSNTPTSVIGTEGSGSGLRRSLRRSICRRSVSQSSQSSTEDLAPMETGEDFSKFLVPSVQESTSKGEVMELDLSEATTPSEHDVEMPAHIKRGLIKEFNKENTSMTSCDESLSVSTQSRRSVHFSLHSPPLEDQVHKLPTTPFNKDSLVPRSRIASGDKVKHIDNLLMMTPDGPGVQSSFSEESGDDSPSTKFSKLRVNYTPGPQNRTKSQSSVDDLLFTPGSTSPLKEQNFQDDEMSPTIDLISFTPASDKSNDTMNTSTRKSALKSSTKRRSVRLQSVSFM